MRIGIFDPYLDTLGGGERYMLTLAECLSRQHEISLFWEDKSILEKASKKFSLDLHSVNLIEDIFSKRSNIFLRYASTKNLDVIFYLSDGSIPLVFAKKLFLHFQFPIESVDSAGLLTRLKMLRVNHILCNSDFTRKSVDKKFPGKSTVLYPPVEQVGVAGRKERNIVTVGRYSKLREGNDYKKHQFLIKVFKRMIDSGIKNCSMTVVTWSLPEHEEEIEKIRESVGRYPISIKSNLTRSSLKKLYQKSLVYWHATGFGEDLDTHPELAEHFGITTVEAMSAGCVPVVINEGGQKEIVKQGKTGYLFDTESELLSLTKKLLSDSTLRAGMAKDAVEGAKRFDTSHFCASLHDLVDETN